MMKIVKEHLYEKFEEEADPIHKMGIGHQGTVYKCHNCGDLIDIEGEKLIKSEEIERSKAIIDTFGENSDRVVHTMCVDCYGELMHQQEQENFARDQERYWQEQQEQQWEDERGGRW